MTHAVRPVGVNLKAAFLGALAAIASIAVALPASAQSAVYETVHSFIQAPGHSFGRLLEASDRHIYGVSAAGGTHRGGAIFKAGPDAGGVWRVVTLHEFAPSHGIGPLAGLAEGPDAALYGTTSAGGAHGGGTIFRITFAGQFQVLHSLNPAVHGYAPLFGPLALGADGAFYGTAARGGARGMGTIFRVTRTGVFTVLRHFSGLDGATPTGGLLRAADGAFYGTSLAGGDQGQGTIFRITAQGAYTRMHSFVSGRTIMKQPIGGMVQGADGSLYGVVTGQYSSSCPVLDCSHSTTGGVFRMTPAGAVSAVAGFGSTGEFNTGLLPAPGLALASDGSLYGLGHELQIFRILSPGQETFSSPEFSAAGREPYGGLIQASDGALYGITSNGAEGEQGSLFRVTPGAVPTVTVLHAFESEGYNPTGRLTLASDGHFYGTAYNGGPGRPGGCFKTGCGTVFRLAGGVASTLTDAPFYTMGGHVVGDLEESSAGTLYVATEDFGFEMTRTGAFVASLFASHQPPIETSPNTLYGVSWNSILRRDPDGSLAVVHLFNGSDGGWPYGGLMKAADGHLYGTTREGGAGGFGTIFRLTVGGQLTTLHHFGFTDGAVPLGRLVQGSDGLLYGTTYSGGPDPAGNGVVYRIAPDGSGFAVVHAFSVAEGIRPVAGLTRGAGDVMFGTATAGGLGSGSIFALNTTGVFGVLHRFGPGEGAMPLGSITVAPDGSLYGTTVAGGAGGVGVVYRLSESAQ